MPFGNSGSGTGTGGFGFGQQQQSSSFGGFSSFGQSNSQSTSNPNPNSNSNFGGNSRQNFRSQPQHQQGFGRASRRGNLRRSASDSRRRSSPSEPAAGFDGYYGNSGNTGGNRSSRGNRSGNARNFGSPSGSGKRSASGGFGGGFGESAGSASVTTGRNAGGFGRGFGSSVTTAVSTSSSGFGSGFGRGTTGGKGGGKGSQKVVGFGGNKGFGNAQQKPFGNDGGFGFSKGRGRGSAAFGSKSTTITTTTANTNAMVNTGKDQAFGQTFGAKGKKRGFGFGQSHTAAKGIGRGIGRGSNPNQHAGHPAASASRGSSQGFGSSGGGRSGRGRGGGFRGFGGGMDKAQASTEGFGGQAGLSTKRKGGFGTGTGSGFGSATTAASGFGSATNSGFGSKQSSGFGSNSRSGFGSNTGQGFGPASSRNKSGFGQASNAAFGAKSPTGFGRKASSGFGSGSDTGFGSKQPSRKRSQGDPSGGFGKRAGAFNAGESDSGRGFGRPRHPSPSRSSARSPAKAEGFGASQGFGKPQQQPASRAFGAPPSPGNSKGFGKRHGDVEESQGAAKKQQWGRGVSPSQNATFRDKSANNPNVRLSRRAREKSDRPQVAYGSLYDDADDLEDETLPAVVAAPKRRMKARIRHRTGEASNVSGGEKQLTVKLGKAANDMETLQSYFERYGPVAKVDSRPEKGTAVVTMASATGAKLAAEEEEHLCEGERMTVTLGLEKAVDQDAIKSGLLKERDALLKRLEQKEKRKRERERERKSAEEEARTKEVKKRLMATSAKAMPAASAQQEEGTYIVGTCEKMCPIEETSKRYNENGIHLLERTHPELPELPAEEDMTVKSFARSSAGLVLNIPKLVRPEAVLLQTLNYLWTEIIDIDAKGPDPRFRDSALYTAGDGETPSVPFIFGFISDRTRSIRKDFSLQGYLDTNGPLTAACIKVFEECARFHIMSDELLCEFSKDEGHDETLNRQEGNNCLKALNHMYSRAAAQDKQELLTNQAEFCAYYILMQMASRQPMTIGAYLRGLPASVRSSRAIQRALVILRAYRRNDYFSFFRILRSKGTPYLVGCLMHGVFHNAWIKALRVLNRSIPRRSGRKLSLAVLAKQLCFESAQHAKDYCTFAGFTVDANFQVLLGVPTPPSPHGAFHRHISSIVEAKRGTQEEDAPVPRRLAVIQSGELPRASPTVTAGIKPAEKEPAQVEEKKPVRPMQPVLDPTPHPALKPAAAKEPVRKLEPRKEPLRISVDEEEPVQNAQRKIEAEANAKRPTQVAARMIANQVLQRQQSMDLTQQAAALISPSSSSSSLEKQEQAQQQEARRQAALRAQEIARKEAEAKARMERLMREAEEQRLRQLLLEQEAQRRAKEQAEKEREMARQAKMQENRAKIRRARLKRWLSQWSLFTAAARKKREEAARADRRKRAFQASLLPRMADGRLVEVDHRREDSLLKRVRRRVDKSQEKRENMWEALEPSRLVSCCPEGRAWKLVWLDLEGGLASKERKGEVEAEWWAHRWLSAKLCMSGRMGEEEGWQQLLRFQIGEKEEDGEEEEGAEKRAICCHRVWLAQEYEQMQKIHGAHGFIMLLPEATHSQTPPPPMSTPWAQRLEEIALEVIIHRSPLPLVILSYSSKLCSAQDSQARTEAMLRMLGPRTLEKFQVKVIALQEEVDMKDMSQTDQEELLRWLLPKCPPHEFNIWEKSKGEALSVEEAIGWCLAKVNLSLPEAAFQWRSQVGSDNSTLLLTFAEERLEQGLRWLGNEKPMEAPVKKFTLEEYLTMFMSCVPFLMRHEHAASKRPWSQAIRQANACINQRNTALKLIIQRLERLPEVFFPGEEFLEEYGLESGWNDYDQVDKVVAGVRACLLPLVDIANIDAKRLEQWSTQFDLMVDYLLQICDKEQPASIYAFVSSLINVGGHAATVAGEAWRALVGFAGKQVYPDMTVHDVQLRPEEWEWWVDMNRQMAAEAVHISDAEEIHHEEAPVVELVRIESKPSLVLLACEDALAKEKQKQDRFTAMLSQAVLT